MVIYRKQPEGQDFVFLTIEASLKNAHFLRKGFQKGSEE
jgi:hypothetical protein